jgi:hypothetical protein
MIEHRAADNASADDHDLCVGLHVFFRCFSELERIRESA